MVVGLPPLRTALLQAFFAGVGEKIADCLAQNPIVVRAHLYLLGAGLPGGFGGGRGAGIERDIDNRLGGGSLGWAGVAVTTTG